MKEIVLVLVHDCCFFRVGGEVEKYRWHISSQIDKLARTAGKLQGSHTVVESRSKIASF